MHIVHAYTGMNTDLCNDNDMSFEFFLEFLKESAVDSSNNINIDAIGNKYY